MNRSSHRVIGSEQITDAASRGRVLVEVLEGDLVTAMAYESAQTLGIELRKGPILTPTPPRLDAGLAMARALHRRSPKWITPRHLPLPTPSQFNKVVLLGAGGLGANIGHLIVQQQAAKQVTFIDIAPGVGAATAMDMRHAGGITRSTTLVTGGEELGLLSGADLVIVTAGRPRSPGMTRTDLMSVNGRVIRPLGEAIRAQANDAVVILVTNPLDEMTALMLQATGFPRERVMGMAGTLDSSRFRSSLALAAGVSNADVEAMALGSHGEEMVPIVSLALIKGQALTRYLSVAQIEDCVADAVSGGGQVVALRKTGSATIAPAHATLELMQYMRGEKSGSVPATVLLQGEFGITGVVLGVPCWLGMKGLIEVDQVQLSKVEQQALKAAAASIRQRLEEVGL